MIKPIIEETQFGCITIAGHRYENDVIIRMDGVVKTRQKHLSKDVYGTSHKVSLDEVKWILQPGAKHLIVGTGQSGLLEFSPEAAHYIEAEGCELETYPTSQVAEHWNNAPEDSVGMFHITC